MNPDTITLIQNIATVVGPVIGAFFVGHYHIILKPSVPTTPAAPGTAPATAPVLRPVGQGGILDALGLAANAVAPTPGAPLAPVGQGGILQIAGLFIQSLLAGPGTTKDKAAAAAAVINATEPFTNSTTVGS